MALLYLKSPFEISNLIPSHSKLKTLIEICTKVDPELRCTMKDAKKLLLEMLYDNFKKEFYVDGLSLSEKN